MTPRELMDALCDCRSEWAGRREAIHEDALYYVSIAEFGHELFTALVEGEAGEWASRAFEVIERAFDSEETATLLVTGMFEPMQNDSYRRGPDDLVESRLGPRALRAWANLIEGWTGAGIRTVAQWRAKASSD